MKCFGREQYILLLIQNNDIKLEEFEDVLKQAYFFDRLSDIYKAQEQMYSVLLDLFPGIEQCVNKDLSIFFNCTSLYNPLVFKKSVAKDIYKNIQEKLFKAANPREITLPIEQFIGEIY